MLAWGVLILSSCKISLFGTGLLNVDSSDKTFVFLSGVSIRPSESEFVPLSSGKSYVAASFAILMVSVLVHSK